MTAATKTILDAPAPWQLEGSGYICLLRCPNELLDEQSFVPDSLRGKRRPSPQALMMFVDYASSPVGPYHELLFIPGSFRFEDGRNHLSISRIFVSSMDSVVNGQRNWGIPKDQAQFDVRYGDGGLDLVTVRYRGKVFADLAFTSWPLPLPFGTGLLPDSWLTLGQHDRGKAFFYQPSAGGWLRPARLVSAQFDPAVFPAVKPEHVMAAVKVTRFDMTFPEAKIIDCKESACSPS